MPSSSCWALACSVSLGALGPAVQAHELLHVLGGAVQPDVEEVGLVLGSGDAGQRPDLGVAELALRECIGEQRQLGQRPGDANLLARGVGIDAAGPGEPVGAGQRPLGGPDLAAVELGDEDQQPVRGGVDVGGEGGDGGGERVVVHGGEIVGGGGMKNSHCSIDFLVAIHLSIIYLLINFNNGIERRIDRDFSDFTKPSVLCIAMCSSV